MAYGGGRRHLADVLEGEILAEKYRVERVLGAGGMGVVVAAHHLQLDEKVAIKLLLPDALGNAEAAERFLREARAAVKIKGEHVASVKDVGTLPNGAPYMVMEYLEGGDLAAWIKQRGALPIEQAVEFVIQACVAVAEAHALHIVHRDLKPANLFCVRRADGQLSIKVLDFGISKMTDATGTGPGFAMTRTFAMMGTPLYMSPEQMRSAKDVDERTDIWALGAVLFELIAGRPPFMAESLMELGSKIAGESPPTLRMLRPEVPEDLEASVLKCLEKQPSHRYRNVGELALAILPFAPRRAKAAVERISGIIQAAGLSASALAVPPSPPVHATTQPAEVTLQPMGRTTAGATRGVIRGKPAAVGIGLVTMVVVSAGMMIAIRSWRVGSIQGSEVKKLPVQGIATSITAAPAQATEAPATSITAAPAQAFEAPLPARSSPPPSAVVTAPGLVASQTARDRSQAISSPIRNTEAEAPGGPLSARATAVAKPSSFAVSEPHSPAPTAKPAGVDCSIPFTIDARDHHVPKPECL